jgi:hypothetical protein
MLTLDSDCCQGWNTPPNRKRTFLYLEYLAQDKSGAYNIPVRKFYVDFTEICSE